MSADDFPLPSIIVTQGEHKGIPWVTAEGPMFGATNGYVRLPDGHPWLDEDADVDTEVPCGEITYRHGNWIGFDTLHSHQRWPDAPEWWPTHPSYTVVMNRNMVTAWAELLAIEASDHLVPHGHDEGGCNEDHTESEL